MIFNINFEQSIASTLLFELRSFANIQEHLEPRDFIDDLSREIFILAETKLALGEPLNEAIAMDHIPNQADAIATQIVGLPPLDTKTLIDFAKKVQDFSKRRQIMDILNHAMGETKEGRPYDLSELNGIEQGSSTLMTNREIIAVMEDRLENKIESSKTGLHELDKFFVTSPGDAIVIAARPSMGKTSLVGTFIWSFIDQGEGSLFFSLEMPSDNIMMRMIASRSGEPISNIKHNKISNFKAYTEVKEFLKGTDLFEMSDIPMDESQISHFIRMRVRANPKIKHIFLDHLTFTKDSGRYKNEHLRIGGITKEFKNIAKEMGLRFWELSQLSRSIESRPNKRPQLSDLRESGAIEENADAVLSIYNETYYTARESGEKQPPVSPVEIGVLKFRDGPTGTAHVQFNGPAVRFENVGPTVVEYQYDSTEMPADMSMEEPPTETFIPDDAIPNPPRSLMDDDEGSDLNISMPVL